MNPSRPPAVVIGLDCITGLQTARILARHGIPVFGIASDPGHFCCRTRVCERIVAADTRSDELIGALESLKSELDQKAVLFPCTDNSVAIISRNRSALDDAYHIALPENDVIELLMDKAKFSTYATDNDLPVPQTLHVRRREEAEMAAMSLRFPCIVKPSLKTPTWERNSRQKAYKVHSADELLAVYDRVSGSASVLLVQEWISGTERDHFTCNCYFGMDGTPLVTFVTRKIRQWPPQTGAGSFAIEFRNDVVLRETMRLYEGVGFRGLGYLEMKRDARTGDHLIIEPNVGRPTGRSATAEAAGVELLYTMYCDVLGLPLPEGRLAQTYRGTKWMYLGWDIRSAFYYWRRGDLSVRDWLNSLRGPKVDAVFSWKDPLPFWFDAWRAVGVVSRSPRGRRSLSAGGAQAR